MEIKNIHTEAKKESLYPELDKMQAARPSSQIIGEFLEAMESKGIVLCEYEGGRHGCYNTINKSTEKILAEYFDIDLDKVDAEKKAILASLKN